MAHGSYSQNPLWGSLVRVIRDILVWEFKDRVVVMSWVSPLVWVRPLHLRIRRTPGVWQIMARDSNDKLFSYKKTTCFPNDRTVLIQESFEKTSSSEKLQSYKTKSSHHLENRWCLQENNCIFFKKGKENTHVYRKPSKRCLNASEDVWPESSV